MRAWIEMIIDWRKENGSGVALFMRAWIEIVLQTFYDLHKQVALFMRAWIEIMVIFPTDVSSKMSPSS